MLQFNGKTLAEGLSGGQSEILDILAEDSKIGWVTGVEVMPDNDRPSINMYVMGREAPPFVYKTKAAYDVVIRLRIEDKEFNKER